jgi:hypothetical protein
MADPNTIVEALEALKKYAPEFQAQLAKQLKSLTDQEAVVNRTVGRMIDGQKAQAAAAGALQETYGLLLKGAKEAEKTKDELKIIVAAYGQIMGEIKKISGLDNTRKRALSEQVKFAMDQYKALSEQTISTQRLVTQQQRFLGLQNQQVKAAQNYNKELNRSKNFRPPGGSMIPGAPGAPTVPTTPAGAIKNVLAGKELTDIARKPVETAKQGFQSFLGGSKQGYTSLDELTTGFAALTGQVMNFDQAVDRQNRGRFPTFAGRVIQLQRAFDILGVDIAEVVASFTTLHTTSRTFGAMMTLNDRRTKKITNSLASFGFMFERVGIKSEDFAKSIDIVGKTYQTSQIAEEAKTLNTELVNMARVTGILPGQLSKDFGTAMNTLAAYSLPKAKEIFKDLALEVASSGVAMETLLGTAKQFDDMSKAADSVGELNAMLGGPYLNTLDMVNATEAERIQMLKDAVAQTGQNFNQMDRFMQKSIADQLGMNVQDASRVFRARSEEEEGAIKRRQEQMASQGQSFEQLMGKMSDGAARNAVSFKKQWGAAIQQASLVEEAYEHVNQAGLVVAKTLRNVGTETRDFIGKHMVLAIQKLTMGLAQAGQEIKKGELATGIGRILFEKETFKIGILGEIITDILEKMGIRDSDDPTKRIQLTPTIGKEAWEAAADKFPGAAGPGKKDTPRTEDTEDETSTTGRRFGLRTEVTAPIEIIVQLDGKEIQKTAKVAIANAITNNVMG